MLSGKDSMANEMDIIVKSIPGLTYIKDFITLEEEERIVCIYLIRKIFDQNS